MTPKTNDRLSLICLTPEQRAQTCDYWYLLRSHGSPYTAFRTRAALEFFLDLHHLELEAPLPETLGTHAFIRVEGATREVMHMRMEDMPADGRRVLKMSNGDYTLGIAVEDDEGVVIHYVNPNEHRITYPHALARAHEDAGHIGPMEGMI